mmetsp:Transcript_15247/g.38475  ORF Transcript_15247/g.38475 Transcript_15247/m.38475 type:complete len:169 (-) Transcript_15247:573-1079(-)
MEVAQKYKTVAETGEKIIASSRRPDGTLRKEIRVRAGYVPQDEVRRYESRAQILEKQRVAIGVVGANFEGEEQKKKARRRKPKKKGGDEGDQKDQEPVLRVPGTSEEIEQTEEEKVEQAKKRVRNLKKRIQQIEKLEQRVAQGENLEPEQLVRLCCSFHDTPKLKPLG